VNIPLVDLQAQYRLLQPEIDAALRSMVQRADFILGTEVAAFEQAFAHFIGTRHCVGVASGTDALFLSLRALGIGPGDKVLVPANTFVATAVAVSQAGAVSILRDIDPDSYTLDVEQARRSLPAGVKAIIPVHLYGQPANMEAILDLAREKGLCVIEDAAQAHGARHRQGPCGTFGRAAAFSFYPAKNLGAYGDGGAVCTNDDALAEQVRLLRNWGSTTKYIHKIRGINSRLDTLQAAVLLVKLRHLAEWNQRRRQVADWYRQELEPLSGLVKLPTVAPWTDEHVYHLFVIRLLGGSRDDVCRRLLAAGIGVGIHYPIPIHLQEAYADLGQGPGSFPATEAAARSILSLPLYPELTYEQVQLVTAAIRQALAPS
jgi:dTDP-4-amino-4,6-dideoxygalactose transaminase